jgi:hypothetical protein
MGCYDKSAVTELFGKQAQQGRCEKDVVGMYYVWRKIFRYTQSTAEASGKRQLQT